jgi:hypothetical protein
MNNCVAKLYDVTDILDAGQVVDGEEEIQPIYHGPAQIAAPTRAWQQQAALEGIIIATLSIHTRTNLLSTKRVVIERNTLAGEYVVVQNGVNGDERNWNMALGKRP